MTEEDSSRQEVEKDVRENVRIGNEPMTEAYPDEALGAKDEAYAPEEKLERSSTEPPACKEPSVPTLADAPCDATIEGRQQAGVGDAWKDVGSQFAALGTGLATAFRTAWTNEESRHHMKEMKGGLEAMVNELGAAIREGTTTPEAHEVRTHAERTVETFRTAGEKTVQEIRPRLVAALNDVNEQVQKLVGRLKKEEEAAGAGTTAAGGPEGGEAPRVPEEPAAGPGNEGANI